MTNRMLRRAFYILAGETPLAYSERIGYNIDEWIGFKTGGGLDGYVIARLDSYE